MFYNEIKLGNLRLNRINRELGSAKVRRYVQGCVVGSDQKLVSIEETTKVFCCPHERK